MEQATETDPSEEEKKPTTRFATCSKCGKYGQVWLKSGECFCADVMSHIQNLKHGCPLAACTRRANRNEEREDRNQSRGGIREADAKRERRRQRNFRTVTRGGIKAG